MKPRSLIVALLACAVLYAAKLATQQITPAVPELAARIEGAFPLNGHFRGESLDHAGGVRFWGSWGGDDANTGALTLGPFPAPPRLRFAVGGYPTREGNQLYAELPATKARLPIKLDFDVGERWRIVDFSPPTDWLGQPITLCARDGAGGAGGWLAVSEPLAGGRGSGYAELFETLAGWAISGVLLGLLWFAALRHVTAHAWVATHWAPLVAAGFVAACGYVAFWLFFANATCGKIFCVTLWLLGLIGALRRPKANDLPAADAMAAPKLMVAIGLFYLGVLHFFPSSLDFYGIAANRHGRLPGDNTLPHYNGQFLYRGEPLRRPTEDWLSSDRPPLQTGWLMLTWPVTEVLHLDERNAGGTATVWLQSLWVFGAYGLLRSLGLARARASAWLAVLALAGFFEQNTVYTWPKLSAAAFACGAFGLWMWEGPRDQGTKGPKDQKTTVNESPLVPLSLGPLVPASLGLLVPSRLLGAMLAGLAWLSHGGVAFSFLALAPWLAWRALRGEWRAWALAAVAFAALALPWLAYQKFYDPPGNRLLKWHLAGVSPKDARGTWQTMRDSYGALSWREIAAHRAANFKRQFEGGWRWWRDFSLATAQQRRTEEFFFTARAFTWWLLGLAALPIVLLNRKTRDRLRANWRPHAALAAWTLATLVLWCLLMFSGGQAVIHQGSYAVMLGLFVLLSAWLEFAAAWAIAVVAVLQAAAFATTWAVPSATINGPLNRLAFALALASACALVALVVREHRRAESP